MKYWFAEQIKYLRKEIKETLEYDENDWQEEQKKLWDKAIEEAQKNPE